MRFFIVTTDYPGFLDSLYQADPDLADRTFAEQYRVRMDQLFATNDFFSTNLRKFGHEAVDMVCNHRRLQLAWAREHVPLLYRLYQIGDHLSPVRSLVKRRSGKRIDHAMLDHILLRQIQEFQPDVLINMAMETIDSAQLKAVRAQCASIRMVIGQISAPLTETMTDLSGYNLIISTLPHFVAEFRARGVQSELLKLAFEETILDRIPRDGTRYDVTHIGGYSPLHAERNQLLETLAGQVPIQFWGYGENNLPAESLVLKNFKGPAWGRSMYAIRAQSRIVVTRHVSSVVRDCCGNMTMFETTGMGALLMTDARGNIREFFEPDREVVTYRSADDCVEKIRYYLAHEDERQKIAQAGQERTLRDHTYGKRMQALLTLVGKYYPVR
jgi:hypothetical protein